MRHTFLFFSFLLSLTLNAQHLRINEIMSSNFTTIADEDGDFEDWIEIYNGTDSIINLKKYALSDKLNEPQRWIFPERILLPDEFLIVFASGKDRYNPAHLHTNFKISISGEYLLLTDSMGQSIDAYPPIILTTDNSYGRFPDGSNNFLFFNGSSPGYSNNGLPSLSPYDEFLTFSHPQGFYTAPINLSINKLNSNSEIYYTTNGSDPDTSSHLYTHPLLIQNKNVLINGLSYISTTSPYAEHPYKWRTPQDVYKASILKARAFVNGIPASSIYTATYFVNPNIFHKYNNLPVISIITDSLNLFGYEEGLFVPGKMSDDNPNYPDYWGYGNFCGRDFEWERPANITFFEGNGSLAFSQDIGIRVHGQSTRTLPLKSLRLYARNLYGKKYFDYKFFPWNNVSSYRRILLRNGGNDFYINMFGDALAALATRDFNFENRDFRPSVVFINGEFWGIHNIRDRVDDSYFEYAFNLLPEDIDYLIYWDYATIGSAEDFHKLLQYVIKNDLADDAAYNYISELMDIDNFVDYIIAKHYIAVYDWPGNNVTIWRNKRDNGKWRWMFFDNDNSFDNYEFDAIHHSTVAGNPTWPNPDISTLLLRNLLRNKHFQRAYLERFAYHLTYSFSETRMNTLVDSILEMIAPVMREHIARWQYPLTMTEWESNVNKMRAFFKYRPCYMKQHLIDYFNITDTAYMSQVCKNLIFDPDTLIPSPYIIKEKVINLYPNPLKDVLNVSFRGYDDIEQAECSLYDVTGRKLFTKVYDFNQNQEIRIHLNSFSTGVYILKIFTKESEYRKIILE